MNRPTSLKRAIFESGLKQADIAASLRMDPAHLSRIVNGLNCTPETRERIALALGVPVEELWPGHGGDRTPDQASREPRQTAASETDTEELAA